MDNDALKIAKLVGFVLSGRIVEDSATNIILIANRMQSRIYELEQELAELKTNLEQNARWNCY